MANKYLTLVNGLITRVEALVTSAGAGDSGKIVALDSAGKLDNSVMPVGIGADTKSIEATENLSAGNLVNVYNSSGQKVRKADAGNAYAAQGFVLSSVTSGQNATVYFEGTITGLTGLTPGVEYFLDDTAGGTCIGSDTEGFAAADIVQSIGYAISTTEISFEPAKPVVI